VSSRPNSCRIGLIATTALLLGGDQVELEVIVGPGARLDLFDVAGTVAYDGKGMPAGWDVRVSLAEKAQLRLSGEPFIVADGARVTRRFTLDVALSATALLRETLVLGRTGEGGGWLLNETAIRLDGEPVCLESQLLDPATTRTLPGQLGDYRIVDTVIAVGVPGPQVAALSGTTQFSLFRSAGTITRHLGHSLDRSPLHAVWQRLELS
jgi:urease accessory protein